MSRCRGPSDNASVRAEWDALPALMPHSTRANLARQALGQWRAIEGPRTRGTGSNRGAVWLVECTRCGAHAIHAARVLQRRTPRCAPYREPVTVSPEDWPRLTPMPLTNRVRPRIAGERYGTLVVADGPRSAKAITGREQARWLCVCDCGRRRVTGANELRTGNVRTCGTCKAPPLPERPRWGAIIALACAAEGRNVARLAKACGMWDSAAEVAAVLDGAPVRRGSVLERRCARIAVTEVSERECLRLGMTVSMIDAALAAMMLAEEARTLADVTREHATRLDRCAA